MDPADLLRQTRAANGSDAMSPEALVALLKAALKVAEEVVPAPGPKPASGPVSEPGSESDSEYLSDTPPYNPFTTWPGANYGEQEDFFLAVAPRNPVKNANRNCALFPPDDLEKTRIGIDISPESPVQLAFVGVRHSLDFGSHSLAPPTKATRCGMTRLRVLCCLHLSTPFLSSSQSMVLSGNTDPSQMKSTPSSKIALYIFMLRTLSIST